MMSKNSTPCPTPEQLCQLVDALDCPQHHDAIDDSVRAHCAACPRCSKELGELRQVRRTLHLAGQNCPTPPAHLVAQISARLDDTSGSVLPLDTRPNRRPYLVLASGAACAVAIGGWALSTQVSPQSASRPDAVDAAQASATPTKAPFKDMSRVERTQAKFTKAGFAQQLAHIVSPAADKSANGSNYNAAQQVAQTAAVSTPAQAAKTPGEKSQVPQTGTIDSALDHLLTSSGLTNCLDEIGTTPEKVYKVALGSWEGKPAAVVLLTGTKGYSAWVVSPGCGSPADQSSPVLHYQKYVS